MKGISQPAEELLASQKDLYSMESVGLSIPSTIVLLLPVKARLFASSTCPDRLWRKTGACDAY
jgi:hypothetical protein